MERIMDVVVDLDGTLCDIDHRLKYVKGPGKKNWKKFFDEMADDAVNVEVYRTIEALKLSGHRIILCSGRPDNYKAVTELWLKFNCVEYDALFMRKDGDYRSDDIVKEELLDEMLALDYTPIMSIDDRKSVVEMWRRKGLVCFQVAPGDF